MSWAQDEWKNSLSHEAFQKVSALEKTVDQLKKDQQQRKFQLESLEVSFENQRKKTEEQKSQVALYRKDLQQLEEQCRVIELNREKVLHDLQTKETQLSCIDGQLSKLKQNLEKETNKCSKLNMEYEREVNTKNKLMEQLEQKENAIKKLEKRLKPVDDVSSNEGSKSIDMLISFDDPIVDANRAVTQASVDTANLLDFNPVSADVSSKLSSGSQNSCSFDIFGVEQNTVCSNNQMKDELKTITDLQAKLQARQIEVTAYQQEKKELLLKFEQVSAELKAKSTACSKAENETQKLTSSIDEKQMRCEELERSLKQIQQQYDCERHNSQAALKAQEERMKLQEKNMREELLRDQQIAKDQVNEVQQMLSETEKKYADSVRDYKSLERIQYQLSHEKELLVQQLEEFKQNISSMKSDHQHLIAEAKKEMEEAHKKEILAYDIRLQEKSREVAVSASEMDKQREEISQLNKSLAEAHERCSHLEESKNQAEKRVSQLTIAMEEGNQSSLVKFKEMEKQFSVKLQDKEEHSKLLAESLKENTRKLEDVSKELAVKKQQFEDTKFKFDSSEATLTKLKKEKSDVQKEYNSFMEETKTRETQLLAALEKSQHAEKLSKDRESVLENAVAKLEHQLQLSKDNLTELSKDSNLKDEELTTLAKQLEISQKTNTEQREQIQSFNLIKGQIQSERDKFREEKERLQSSVERVNSENDKLKARNEEICVLEERYESEICNLKMSFEREKEEIVQQYQETEANLQKELAAKDLCNAEAEAEKQRLRNDCQQAEKDLNEKLQMIADKDSEMENIKDSHVVEKEQLESNCFDVTARLEKSQEDLRNKSNEVKQMEKDFQEQYSSLKTEIQVRTEECDNYLDQIGQLKESVEALQQIKVRNEANMQMFVEDQECLLIEKNELAKQYDAAQEELKDLHTRVNNLSHQKEDMATALLGKDEEIRQLHEKQTQIENDLHAKEQDLRNSVSELTNRCDELENDVTTLTSQKDHAEKHLQRFQEQNESISHELSSLSVLYEQMKTENNQLSAGIQSTNTKLEESDGILHSKEAKIQELVTQIDGLRDDLQMKTKTYEDLTTEHQHLQVHLESIREDLGTKSALLAEKQNEIAALNDQSTSEITSLSTLLDERNREISELHIKVEELERKITELDRLISEKEGELREAYETIKSLESQLEIAVSEAKESVEKKKETEAKLQNTIVSLEESECVIQEKNELVLSLQNDVEEIRNEMHEKLAERNKEMGVLSTNMEEAEKSVENLKVLLTTKDDECKVLFDKVQNLSDELAASCRRLDEQNVLLDQQKMSVTELSEKHQQKEILYDSATKKINDLESQIECSEKKIVCLSAELQETIEKIVTQDEELKSVKTNFQSKNEDCISLREQLENKTADMEKLGFELEKLGSQVNEFETERRRLCEENIALEKELLASKETYANVEKERDGLMQTVHEKEECIERMSVVAKRYEENELVLKQQMEVIGNENCEQLSLKESEIRGLKEDVKSLDERLKEQAKEIEEMTSEILNQQTLNEQQNRKQEELIGEVSNLKSEKESLKKDLVAKESDLNDLLNQAEETDELMMNLKTKNESLSVNLKAESESLLNLKFENESLSVKYTEIIEQQNRCNEELSSLYEQMKEITEVLNAKSKQCTDLKEEAALRKDEYEDEISSYKQQHENLKTELSMLVADKESLQNELSKKESEFNSMLSQAEETGELVMNLRCEIESLKNKFKEEQSQHLKENEQLQESLNKKQGQMKGLFDGNNVLQEKIVAFASQIDSLQNKLKKGKDAYDKDCGLLKEQIAGLETKLAEKIKELESITDAGEEMKIAHDNVVCELRSQQNALTEEFNTFKNSSLEDYLEIENKYKLLLEERDAQVVESGSQLQSLRASYEADYNRVAEEYESKTNELKSDISQHIEKIERLEEKLQSTLRDLDISHTKSAELTKEKDDLNAELSATRKQHKIDCDSYTSLLQENADTIASLQEELETQAKTLSEELEGCKQASLEKEVENANVLRDLKDLEAKYGDLRLKYDTDMKELRSDVDEKDHELNVCRDIFEKEKAEYISCKENELNSVEEQLGASKQELDQQRESFVHLQQKYELLEKTSDTQIKELNEDIVEKVSKIHSLLEDCKEHQHLVSDLKKQVETLELELKKGEEALTDQVRKSESEITRLNVLMNEKCDVIHSLKSVLQNEHEEKKMIEKENLMETLKLEEAVMELTRVKDDTNQKNGELKCAVEKLEEELSQLKIKREQDLKEFDDRLQEKETVYEVGRGKLIADRNEAVLLKEEECEGLRTIIRIKEENVDQLQHQLSEMENEKSCLKSELESGKEIIKAVDKEKSELKCSVEKLTEQVVLLEKLKNDAESDAQSEMSTLQTSVFECRAKLDATTRALDDYKIKYDDSERQHAEEKSDLHRKLEAAENLKNEVTEELQGCKISLTDVQDAILKLGEQREKLHEQNEELRKQIQIEVTRSGESVKKYQDSVSELENELSNNKHTVSKHRIEIDELTAKLSESRQQHAELSVEMKTLGEKFANKAKDVERLEKKLIDEKDSTRYVETIKEELMAQLEVARKKLDEEKTNKQDTSDKIEAQSETIRNQSETIRNLSDELTSAKESIEYVNTIKDEITQQLTTKSTEYEAIASKLEKEKGAWLEQVEALQKDITEINKEKEHFENEKNKLKICFDTLHQENHEQHCDLVKHKNTSEELRGELQAKVNELREMEICLGNEKEEIVRCKTEISRLKVGNEDMKEELEQEKKKLEKVQNKLEQETLSAVELQKGLETKCVTLRESEEKLKEALLKLGHVENDLILEKEKAQTKQSKLEQIKRSLLRSQSSSADGAVVDSDDSLNESIDFNSCILQLQEQNAKLEKEKKKCIEEALEEERLRIVEASKQFVLHREKENEAKNQDLIDKIHLQEKKIDNLQQKLSQQEEECHQLEFNIQKQKEAYEALLVASEEEKKGASHQGLTQQKGDEKSECLQEQLDKAKLMNEELKADFTKLVDDYERTQKKEAREIEKLKKQCEKFKYLCEKKDNELKCLRTVTREPLKNEKLIEDLRDKLSKSDEKYVEFQFKNEDLVNELKDLKRKHSSEVEVLNDRLTSLTKHGEQLRQKLDEALHKISQLEIENDKLKKELRSHPFVKNSMVSPLTRTLSSMNFHSSGDDEVKTDSDTSVSERTLENHSHKSILKKSSETPKRNLDVSETTSLKNTKRTRLNTVIEVSDGMKTKSSPPVTSLQNNRRRSARLSQKPYQREVLSASSSDEEVLNKQISSSSTSHPVKENLVQPTAAGSRVRHNDLIPLAARKDNLNNTLNSSNALGPPTRALPDKTNCNTLKNAGPMRVTRMSKSKLETSDTILTRKPLAKEHKPSEEEKCNMQ